MYERNLFDKLKCFRKTGFIIKNVNLPKKKKYLSEILKVKKIPNCNHCSILLSICSLESYFAI